MQVKTNENKSIDNSLLLTNDATNQSYMNDKSIMQYLTNVNHHHDNNLNQHRPVSALRRSSIETADFYSGREGTGY